MKYEVKDVCRMTGLTRRQMFDFRNEIKPIAYKNEAGYKIFDDKAVDQFRQIAVYKELGFLPYQIKAILATENSQNEDEILLNQIKMLRDRQKEISDMLYVAEKVYEMGSSNINFLSYIGLDISEIAEMLRKEETKQEYIEFENKINELTEEEEKRFVTILKNFVELKNLSEDKYEVHKKKCISCLEIFFETVFGANKYLLFSCCSAWLMGGAATKELNKIIGETNAEFIGDILAEHYSDIWWVAIEKYLDGVSDVINDGNAKEADDPMLRKLAIELHKDLIEALGEYPILAFLSTCGILEECLCGKSEVDESLIQQFGASGKRIVEEEHTEQEVVIDSLWLYAKECYMLTKNTKEEANGKADIK